jgi:hypothetical protein
MFKFNFLRRRKEKAVRELLKNALVLILAIYNVRRKDFTETEDRFMQRALEDIAISIGRLGRI